MIAHMGAERQTNIHADKHACTHSFRKAISRNQARAYSRPMAGWGHVPGLKRFAHVIDSQYFFLFLCACFILSWPCAHFCKVGLDVGHNSLQWLLRPVFNPEKKPTYHRAKVYLYVSHLKALFSVYFLYNGCFCHCNGLLMWVSAYGQR